MLGIRIRERRKALKLNQDVLGELVGVARQTISSWENGTFEPEGKNLGKVAAALQTSVGYLLGETNDPTPPTSDPSVLVSSTQRSTADAEASPITVGEEPVWIPIVEPHVCAGGGNGYCEIDWEPVGRYPFIPADFMGIAWHSGTLRIIRVDGNSMEPRYRDGDMIIFSEEHVESGDTIIALWDGRLFLRGYIEDKRNRSYRLKALNPDYADIVIDIEDERFQSLGKVVAKVNKLEFDRGFW